MRTVFVAVLVLLAGPVLALPAIPPKKVTFTTQDGLRITGTWYRSGQKGLPAVVALPMYRHDRSSWKPVADRFKLAGIHLLAIDLRGHGDSAKQGEEDLSERVDSRDPKLFNAMWRDALAAREFLISKGADPRRIGLLGASVGCSVAIDAASRDQRILGVCVMTPGKNYLGVDTMGDLAAYGKRPMLILSSKEEAGIGATAIRDELGDPAELVLFDRKDIHGTKMLGKVRDVEKRIADWFCDLLAGGVVLDGRRDRGRPAPRHKPWTVELKGGKSLLFLVEPRGRWWHATVVADEETAVPKELELALRNGERGFCLRWNAVDGTWTRKMLSDGLWVPVRVKAAAGPGPAGARDLIIEILVPAPGGFKPGPDLKARVTAKVGDRDVTSGWKPVAK